MIGYLFSVMNTSDLTGEQVAGIFLTLVVIVVLWYLGYMTHK